jgi:hypothetical protein
MMTRWDREKKAEEKELKAQLAHSAADLKWRDRELAKIKATEEVVEAQRKETLARLHYLNNSTTKTFYNTLKDASQEEPHQSERRAAMAVAKAAEEALAAQVVADAADRARRTAEREIREAEGKKAKLQEKEEEVIAANKRVHEEKLAWKAATKRQRR